MAKFTQARRRGQMLSNRRNLTGGIAPGDTPTKPTTGNMVSYGAQGLKMGVPKAEQRRNLPGGAGGGTWNTGWGGTGGTYPNTGNHLPSGQSPPIIPGQTVPHPQGGNPLPPAVRDALQAYAQQSVIGAQSIPGQTHQNALVGMRQFLKAAQAAGIKNKGLMNFLEPTFYRGMSDPNGGARMLKYGAQNFTPEQFKAAAKFANTNTVARVGPDAQGNPGTSGLLSQAVPGLNDPYMAMAHPNGPLVWDAHVSNFVPAGKATPGTAYTAQDQAIIEAWNANGGDWNSFTAATGITPSFRNAGTASLTNSTDPNVVASRSTYGAPQLGSDGQYHDINQPLPPGVTLKPPEGATAPQTQPVSAVAEAAHGTPQAAINAGKDPTKHMAYWEDKGWTYNPATDQWTNRNGGGAAPAPVSAPAQAGAASAEMPLDPAYIAAQRAAQLQLNSTLQGVDPALEQINAQNQLALARMQTNQDVDTQALMEALSSRGALQSSIYGTERGNLATNYLRTGQDLAADVANAQSQVYQQQQSAYNDYYAALIEALLASANASATSPYTPVGRTKPKKPKKKRGNNRGGR